MCAYVYRGRSGECGCGSGGYWDRACRDRRVRDGWVVGWVDGWVGGVMGGWMGLKVGFININDMYNNDIGKGGSAGL